MQSVARNKVVVSEESATSRKNNSRTYLQSDVEAREPHREPTSQSSWQVLSYDAIKKTITFPSFGRLRVVGYHHMPFAFWLEKLQKIVAGFYTLLVDLSRLERSFDSKSNDNPTKAQVKYGKGDSRQS